MLARIVDNQFIFIDQITQREEDVIYQHFSVQIPNARYIDIGGGNFDGWYRKYSRKYRRLSRALLGELRMVCKKYRLPLTVTDERSSSEYPTPSDNIVTDDLLPGIKLYDYQLNAVRATCYSEVGCIKAPTGSGKGEMIAAITKIHDCPTVIIAEQLVVIDQLKERLELRDVIEEVGLFCSGHRPSGQKVIIGSIQSLSYKSSPPKRKDDESDVSYDRKIKAFKTRKKNAQYLRKEIAKCHMLLVDEADRSSSKPYARLFKRWFIGRRKYGFSGTYDDPNKPVENLTIKEFLGSIIVDIPRKAVEDVGRIVPVRYSALAFGLDGDKRESSAFDIAVSDWMIKNIKFHDLVAKLCAKKTANKDHGVLILVGSIKLGQSLEKLIPNSRFICGTTSQGDRRTATKQFENREIQVLIGSKIVDRGLDLKGGCEALVLATGGKLPSNFEQRVGRALRLNKAGESHIYDFFFVGNKYLYAHSRERLKTIVAMEYPATVVFPGKTIDARSFIKSRYRTPKL